MAHIVIIGAGPGGEAAAKRAAAKGAQVTLVEKRDLGGLCLNRGCIPSKTLLEAGRLAGQARAASAYLKGSDLRVDWPALVKRKDEVVASLRKSLSQNLNRLGVKVLQGEARFIDSKTLSVKTPAGEEKLTFDKAVVATGSQPYFPGPLDALRGELTDSDRALDLPSVPKTLLVIGGGAVGCEFACLFHELGARVTIVEMKPTLIPGEDAGVVRALRTSFEKRGIAVKTEVTAASCARAGAGWKVKLSDGSETEAERVLVAVGRRPDVTGLGLEKAGVTVEKGRVAVDGGLRTSSPDVYCVGDANGLSLLAHAAAAQGETAAENALGGKELYPHHLVPRCLYTWPEVASVGEWIHTAEEKGLAAASKRFFFQGSAKAIAANEPEGFIQIVLDKASDKILGAQIIGPHATEIIHVFSVALGAGLTAAQLRATIYAHPTLSEGVKEALSR